MDDPVSKKMERAGRFRVGAVQFFNARPLIYGLEQEERVELRREVPARLAAALAGGRVDAALLPSIDYQKAEAQWQILPVPAIGSCGEVVTVRVFSQVPPEQVEQLYCDTDSHTSVVLAQILWRGVYGRELAAVPLAGRAEDCQSVLLIGDKVLPQLAGAWGYQLDLGQLWTQWTGLPFLYAFWVVPQEGDYDLLVRILEQAYESGMRNLDALIERYGPEHGFSRAAGRSYFAENIRFGFGEQERAGLRRFYELAYEMKLTQRKRELRFYPGRGADLAAGWAAGG